MKKRTIIFLIILIAILILLSIIALYNPFKNTIGLSPSEQISTTKPNKIGIFPNLRDICANGYTIHPPGIQCGTSTTQGDCATKREGSSCTLNGQDGECTEISICIDERWPIPNRIVCSCSINQIQLEH